MPDSTTLIREKLKACNLPALFIEELGWNHHRAAPLVIQNDDVNYVLNAIAEKHGMVAYECQPGPWGQIPDYPTRGKIERQVAKSAHEHIIVFVDQDRTMQTWQWVRREKGRPIARREHTLNCAQTGELLVQKIGNLIVDLKEEEKLTIVDVTEKARKAFDVEQVTKRFYDQFKKEHAAFLAFIEGITAVGEREWYASLMLNRLMFIYFIQKKKFLDADINYLRNRLQKVRQSQGTGKFHSFYRHFLRRLFHEGLAQPARTAELAALLGNVPYLNGGLFDTHQLENENPEIHIPDEAFEKLFDFFDHWEWNLDIRANRPGNEINPDVLGYIFEKYINQKQMGAYYTKEDITEYISKSTIVPFLFDAAEKKCARAFRPEGAVWRLLRDDPDRYFYDAVKKGVDLPLPEDIAAGVADVSKRGGWNRPADEGYALPTETWREHVARRTRCLEVRAKLAAGEIHSINDLVTYNLDLRQFGQDVIETSEDPALLRAIHQSIAEISVLDPTCGSGAFLFAALNILEPLYEACLERMEVFVEELDKSGEKHHPQKFSDFRKVLEQANDRTRHPSRRYFVLKSIVLKNLYGVDIMAEAVEICKLRLFLKLVAQVERVEDVEPLPDIDFNIRAGNTLVGFTSLEAVRQAMTVTVKGQSRLPSPEDEAALKSIDESAELSDKAFRRFRDQQTDYGTAPNQYSDSKTELQTRLAALRTELDRYLAIEYGIDLRKPADFERWRSSHQPFHWFVEFYGIMQAGGFDAVIGNPPYVEYSKVKHVYEPREYVTENCGNVYALVVERTLGIVKREHSFGMILPLSAFCTQRMLPLVSTVKNTAATKWISHFGWRPATLFSGVNIPLSILLMNTLGHHRSSIFTTTFNKWYTEKRSSLFHTIGYSDSSQYLIHDFVIPKIGSPLEQSIIRKLLSEAKTVKDYQTSNQGGHPLYYRNTGGLYWRIITDFQPEFVLDGERIPSSTMSTISLRDGTTLGCVSAVLNSNLFWMFYVMYSSFHHVNPIDITSFPINLEHMDMSIIGSLVSANRNLMTAMKNNSKLMLRQHKGGNQSFAQTFFPSQSKDHVNQIDVILSDHYRFSAEELDYIINYDVRFRLSSDDGEE